MPVKLQKIGVPMPQLLVMLFNLKILLIKDDYTSPQTTLKGRLKKALMNIEPMAFIPMTMDKPLE